MPELKKEDYSEVYGRTRRHRYSRQASESDELNQKVFCDYCGNQLRRLVRKGFMQKNIYSWFGYYPWECPLCREPMLVKQQHLLKKRGGDEPEAVGVGTAETGAEGR